MVERMLKKYISKLKIEDVYDYSLKNGIKLTDKEATIIFNTIKNDWEEIAFKDESAVLARVKNDLNEETYYEIVELLNHFKEKYKNYL